MALDGLWCSLSENVISPDFSEHRTFVPAKSVNNNNKSPWAQKLKLMCQIISSSSVNWSIVQVWFISVGLYVQF